MHMRAWSYVTQASDRRWHTLMYTIAVLYLNQGDSRVIRH